MRPGVFLPYHMSPSRRMTIAVRTLNDPLLLLPSIRKMIQQRDPDLPIFQIRTMAERVKTSLWLRRSYSGVFVFFAAVALVMAMAGVYGVISYAVSQRRNEIGIRMALGALPGDVLRLVLRHGLILAGIGTALGWVGALGLTRVTRSLLVGVADISPTDPVTLIAVPLLLVSVTLLACLLPARKAARVDPMEALRDL
jgi:ABC-type antimicrobial peptide transport system permease subunit